MWEQGPRGKELEGRGIALTQEEEAGKESRRRKASQAEGEGRGGDRREVSRASTGEGHFSDQRNSPPGMQKHRVSIWHKVSTERSKIPLSVIRNVLNQ